MAVRWSLNSIDFAVNPVSVNITKRKTFHMIKLIGGAPILQQGRDEPYTMTLEIIALAQAGYDKFNTWYNTNGTITLVDDHSESFTVVIESLDLKRNWAADREYYYTGTMTLRVF